MSKTKVLTTDWEIIPLGKIVTIKYGKNLPTKILSDKGYPVFGANGIIGFHSEYLYRSEQVLISCRGAYSGKFNWSPPNCFVTNNSLILELDNDDLDFKKYLYYALHTVDKSKLVTGSAQPQVTINNAVVLKIPLAPPQLRKPIVAEIEKQFSRLDEAVASLKRIHINLKRYKAAVLKAAVEGKLTEQWRKDHSDFEPAEQLLKRILAERRAKWEESIEAKVGAKQGVSASPGFGDVGNNVGNCIMGEAGESFASPLPNMKAKGIKPKDDSWKKKYKEPAGPNTANLPELPEGWVWTSVEQLGDVIGGLTKNPKRANLPQKLPYLRVANVYANELRLDEIEHIGVEDKELTKLLVLNGDLLIVEGNGSPEQIGRAAIWDGSIEPCVHQNHLIKVRLSTTCLSKWTLYWLLSPNGRNYIREVSNSTSGLYTLSVGKVSGLPTPLTSIAEQKQIVDEVERCLSVFDELEATIETNLKRAERLRQTILQQAFSGELL